jgi:hypothetical protein
MPGVARYLILQHLPDPFRREPRNVGVVVAKGEATAARFYGENALGELDGRRLRSFDYPDVYRQWVDFWKRTLHKAETPEAAFDHLLQSGKSHFVVVPGGEVTDTANDSADQIAHYLYSLLVSDGGLTEALGANEDVAVIGASFQSDVGAALAQAGILAHDEFVSTVKHPVRSKIVITGHSFDQYRPTFTQENGSLYVMEPVDLTMRNKQSAKNLAGMTAYMFIDIQKAHRNTQPISLVRYQAQDEELEPVRLALSILRNESDLVDWGDAAQRERFLRQRAEVASS